MVRRGRHESPRTTELGRYIQERRGELGWTVLDLARAANVPHKALSKLELSLRRPTKSDILLKLAKALDIHPDRLLLRAVLTPYLRPGSTAPPPAAPDRAPLNLLVTGEERRLLEHYLEFLRFMAHLNRVKDSQ